MPNLFSRLKPVVATLLLATLPAALLPATARASSHMDAPLITLDPSANTTDVYAFVDQDGTQKSLVLALGVSACAPKRNAATASRFARSSVTCR